jgi:hypothetical protein
VKREEFEHVLRAAADVTKDDIVVIGSQALLAEHPNPPAVLTESIEADVFPRNNPGRADEIDGAIGDGSRFHETFGYYAHGVGPETAIAPEGWEDRLIRLDVPALTSAGRSVTAWCLETHDLVVAKLAAGRDRDYEFARAALDHRIVDAAELRVRADLVPKRHRQIVRQRLEGVIARLENATS